MERSLPDLVSPGRSLTFVGMQAHLVHHLRQNFPFLEGRRLLLAVSGGIDSIVMAELMRLSGYDTGIAHCNFALRGAESDQDAAFVERYAAAHGLSFHYQRFDTEAFARDFGLSIQVAARRLRYEWFAQLLGQEGYDFILTAHHADDDLETFLIHLSRGTGLDGLTGIPAVNGKVVRPLLAFSREEIEAYARSNGLEWREDSSNASDKYLRNRIRQVIVPELKALNPSFLTSFRDTLAHLNQSRSLAEDASRIVYRKIVTDGDDRKEIDLGELLKLPDPRAYLYHWLAPLGFTAWDDIYALVGAQSGKQVYAPGFRLLKDRSTLLVTPLPSIPPSYEIGENITETDNPVKLVFTPVDSIAESSDNVIFVDRSKLRFPLELRKWRQGDVFRPAGMTGSKKVSKFFKDERFSLADKEDAWLLTSGDDIVWIVGHRQDARFKADETTQDKLNITLNP